MRTLRLILFLSPSSCFVIFKLVVQPQNQYKTLFINLDKSTTDRICMISEVSPPEKFWREREKGERNP
ncbi:hypothetical protein L596_016010 [Steinernema carpocapsae]|uniref:Secreted protein n=1 Tax=Steinernema carpocapsae TaxID=34508 RepID=A0A4U5NHC0_STECR|nr:hypothetical protein L596_016010 [Steinernema carpocapsae]